MTTEQKNKKGDAVDVGKITEGLNNTYSEILQNISKGDIEELANTSVAVQIAIVRLTKLFIV